MEGLPFSIEKKTDQIDPPPLRKLWAVICPGVNARIKNWNEKDLERNITQINNLFKDNIKKGIYVFCLCIC